MIIEYLYRGYSHWTMLLLGGACFIALGSINEIIPWDMPLIQQSFVGACIVTLMEFITGCIVNLWLGWDVWDYSDLPFNILGQICPEFFIIWMIISTLGIVIDDYLRYWFFGEEKPHYTALRGG